MFGDDDQNQNDQQQSAGMTDGGAQQINAATEPSTIPAPAYSPASPAPQGDSDTPASASLPGLSVTSSDPVSSPSPDTTVNDSFASAASDGNPAPEPAASSQAVSAGDSLLDIKKQALAQLSPLVDKLDQSPEEKFRTTMMMIQASDNKDLIKDAYAAAQQIGDEKERAQALLDIINEINYFTQRQG